MNAAELRHPAIELLARYRAVAYFSFGGLPRGIGIAELKQRLQILAPHLHQAVIGVHRAQTHATAPLRALTTTERELLRWAAAGRTNAEIARLRARSAATIRNQMTAIYKKLGVGNRAEAARLLGAGWI